MRRAAIIAMVLGCLCANAAQAQWPYSSRNNSSSSSSGFATGGTIYGGTATGRPIGTATSDSARYFGPSGFSPAPGVSSATGMGLAPGQFFYYNNPGIGYYRTNPSASQFPAYPAPISLGGGYYQLGGLTSRIGYWRAPSGYYYPWCPPVYMPALVYPQNPAIYMMAQGVPTAFNPPVGSVISDMRQFIEEAKSKKQLDVSNYENLFHRLNDITARSSELAAKNGGALNVSDEREIRKQLDLLSADIARSLTP